MAITHIDTEKMVDLANNIINSANEYNVIINKMFSRISNVPYETKEWIGKQSSKYVDIVLLEKEDFTRISNTITAYGKKVISDSEAIERLIKETNISESSVN